MKERAIKKGTKEAEMFSELIMFRQRYYLPESESDFETIVTKADEFSKKYENEYFGHLARQLVINLLEDVELRVKNEHA